MPALIQPNAHNKVPGHLGKVRFAGGSDSTRWAGICFANTRLRDWLPTKKSHKPVVVQRQFATRPVAAVGARERLAVAPEHCLDWCRSGTYQLRPLRWVHRLIVADGGWETRRLITTFAMPELTGGGVSRVERLFHLPARAEQVQTRHLTAGRNWTTQG